MDGFAFPVEVLRTNRRKAASIRLDGDLVKVSVPMSLSDSRIRDLVTRKTSWIKKKLKEQFPEQKMEYTLVLEMNMMKWE